MPRITDAVAKQAKPRDTRYDIRDKDGFLLRVMPTGTRVWQHVFDFQGKRHRVRLGTYPGKSVKVAEQRRWWEDGLNPAEVVAKQKEDAEHRRHEEHQAPTVSALVNEYLEQYAKQHKKSWEEDERILRGYLIPALGRMKAKTL